MLLLLSWCPVLVIRSIFEYFEWRYCRNIWLRVHGDIVATEQTSCKAWFAYKLPNYVNADKLAWLCFHWPFYFIYYCLFIFKSFPCPIFKFSHWTVRYNLSYCPGNLTSDHLANVSSSPLERRTSVCCTAAQTSFVVPELDGYAKYTFFLTAILTNGRQLGDVGK